MSLSSDICVLLKGKSPLDRLSPECFEHLCRHVETATLGEGDVLFQLGDRDPHAVFLLSGEVDLVSEDGRLMRVGAEDAAARFALANLRPRKYRGEVRSERVVVAQLDNEVFEKCIAMDQFASGEQDLEALTDVPVREEDQSWVMQMLRSKEFMRLPVQNLMQALARAEDVAVSKGDVVIRQGEPGFYFYLVAAGRCKVSRRGPNGEIVLDEIGPGEPFGETALLSEEPRNATITMLEDGLLKRLSKLDFKELLEKPMLCWVDGPKARELLAQGAVLLDVRTEEEVAQQPIPGATNIPLFMLRVKMRKMKPGRRFVTLCDSGIRSATAAYLLNQQGFDAWVVEGGAGQLGPRKE